MRIRKHAKLSSLLFSLPSQPPPLPPETPPTHVCHLNQSPWPPPETPQTHVCQLNQSPWDVIPFSSFPYQLDGEDFFFSGNGTAHGPAGATQSSIASDVGTPKQVSGFDFSSNEHDLCNDDDNGNSDSDFSYGAEVGDSPVKGIMCKKTNGKSWRCTRAAREGHYYCDYHSKPRRHSTNISYTAVAAAEKDGPPVREVKKRRGRPPKKKAGAGTQAQAQPTATKSNQFYYYSGFGPLWGKRRNERGASGWESLPEEIEAGSSPPTPSSSLQIDDEDEEVSSDSGGRKRVRKPVKARSLKSLM